ncbi:hypothetical protein J7E24_13835 [Hymenobacter sp. ISL-91]|uniref:hypothetical protein n=1 Tax=Hymenobacter sp. ISL-91 TaxID=2819151 RepID=UPI001BE8F98C|nr:hypothetical protein [Hymenobacter sp. ISL-91]MBT2558872.1 hypothetical protein [Hymenobacter sp. ISL-91]
MLINKIQTEKNVLAPDFSIIETDYELLISDEYPVLYVGRNQYGSWIIGSFLEEDEDDLTVLYYIHFIVKNIDYLDFISKRRSYRDIFEISKNAFIVKKDLISLTVSDIFSVNADDIPSQYKPHRKSYYPGKRKSSSSSYKITLKGGIADAHHALTKDLLNIQSAVVDVFSNTIESLPNLGLTTEIFQFADTEGSFQLNFEVSVDASNAKSKDLFFREGLFSVFQNDLIEYIVKYLPEEVNDVYSVQEPGGNFRKLCDSAKALYSKLGKAIEDEELFESLKSSIHSALNDILKASESVGKNYDSIEFISIEENGDGGQLIGYVTKDNKSELMDTAKIIDHLEQEEESDDTVADDEHQIYNIYIHNLNTETRKGAGTVMFEDGNAARVKVSISGSDVLEETKYTESLYAHKFIKVSAIGIRKKGFLKKLEIDFDLSQ